MRALPRHLVPGLWAALIMGLLALLMDRGRAAGLALAAVNAAALVYFAIVVAAPLVLYPIAFFRGEPPRRRIAAALLPFLAWWLGQVALRWTLHPLPQAVFMTLALPNLLHAQLLALEMVLLEVVCRGIARLRGAAIPVFSRSVAFGVCGVLVWILSNAVLAMPYFVGFQRLYGALFAVSSSGAPQTAPAPLPRVVGRDTRDLPNLVVILSDDHRHDFSGHAGHPFVETPSLDRLAEQGVRFRHAFVTSSLCSPSRATLLTGVEPERHGVRDNSTPWSDANRTFFEYLKPLGYRTAFIGKWHMPGGLPSLRGVDHFVTFTAVGGQGAYRDCPLIVDGRPEPSRRSYVAEELTDRALDFIDAHADAPFVLYLSHKNVHAPFTPDPREAGRYAEQPVPLPAAAPHSWYAMTGAQYVHFSPEPGERVVRHYAESVTSLDREIGRVLDRLDALDPTRESVVVYTSDNGYLWGEHGLVDKRWAYEASIRVPFLLRHPRHARPGAVIDALVLNLDLAPTLLELAGVPVPAQMQGRSLLPLLRDPQAAWREAFHYGYDFEPPYPVPRIRAVRTGRYKYVDYAGRAPELFDLQNDPEERSNLAGAPGVEELERSLRARLVAQMP